MPTFPYLHCPSGMRDSQGEDGGYPALSYIDNFFIELRNYNLANGLCPFFY